MRNVHRKIKHGLRVAAKRRERSLLIDKYTQERQRNDKHRTNALRGVGYGGYNGSQ